MTLDLSPLFRSTVGFDRIGRLFDEAFAEAGPAYPPYNIEKTGEDTYRIVMAVAGFAEKDLAVQVENRTLTVEGKQSDKDEKAVYLHRGIAARAFVRRFELADYIVVDGAKLENGLLVVALKREVPEALKPRQIAIGKGAGVTLEHKRAA